MQPSHDVDLQPIRDRTSLREELPTILDRGVACDALAVLPPDPDPLSRVLLASSCDLLQGRLERAGALARDVIRALEVEPETDPSLVEVAVTHVSRVAAVTGDPVLIAEYRRIARDRDVGPAAWVLAGRAPSALDPSRRTTAPSYRRGAELARTAAILVARGDPAAALEAADEARGHLERTGSPREAAFATLTAADALALLGRDDLAAARWRSLEQVAARDPAVARSLAEHVAWFGDPVQAARRLRACGPSAPLGEGFDHELVDVGLDPAAILRSTARSALAASVAGSVEASALIRSLAVLADRLGATVWAAIASLLDRIDQAEEGDRDGAAATGGADLEGLAERIEPLAIGPVLGMIAPVVVRHLDRLDPASLGVVSIAAASHPERWRPFLRSAVTGSGEGDPARRLAAARLLALVGDGSDVALLDGVSRALASRSDDRRLAKSLARRVAPVLEVADLGRVAVSLGGVPLGPIGRRKVLALLCFLVTRSDLAATREQVLDALWPDQDPETGANSLNQTIYFLRRTLEPAYRERVSPEYLHHDSEVVWLDERLMGAASRRCRDLALAARRDGIETVEALAAAYVGRFALDFSYDPWAESYREGLHATYLATMEAGIAAAIEAGDVARGIALAQRTLAVDPAAEGIELALLRLYRRTGAHAAAAEQYAHYASVLRDELGVEPPPLETL